jgi:phosphoglycerol transferase MdoB-like AlkP superfamily enzyme
MILTLGISDFVYHLAILMTLIQTPPLISTLLQHIIDIGLYFSATWPLAIAFLAYLSLTKKSLLDPESYFRNSLMLNLPFAITLTGCLNYFGPTDKLFTMMVATSFILVSMGVTTFCYVRCINILESLPSGLLRSSKGVKTRNLYLYSFIQLITIFPIMCYLLIGDLSAVDSPYLMEVVLFLINFAGAVNVLIYFVLRQQSSNKGSSNKAKWLTWKSEPVRQREISLRESLKQNDELTA